MTQSANPTNSVRPTKKQQELLVYIEQFIGEHGYSPSYREIMNGCQYTSVATVALHVGNLIKRGHLRKRDRSARSIEVVKTPELMQALIKPEAMLAAASGREWLLEQTEYHIQRAERSHNSTQEDLDNIEVLLKACSVLQLTAQAEPLSVRFETLAKDYSNTTQTPSANK